MSGETASAQTVMQWCDILGRISEEEDCLARPFATAAMRRVNEVAETWMQAAGMQVTRDAIGNCIGRYEGQSKGAKTLVLGSHLDSVRDAGRYDGPLGVMVALACVQRLHTRQERLPFAIEVVGFADEEGMRFSRSYLGSKAITGTFDASWLDIMDAEGISMAEAIRAFGGNPEAQALQRARWSREELVGYAEVHIEQGPVLEELGLPVGVVTAIAGQSRVRVTLTGMAGHAGTVPMEMRRDALSAAAECITAVERIARSVPGSVATVGQVTVQPGASNVIPGKVIMSLDVRHQDDAVRVEACQQIFEQGKMLCDRRGVAFDWQELEGHEAVACSRQLARHFMQAIDERGLPVHSLPSGAGHDAATMSAMTNIAMLFVRCKGGISHNPAESVTTEDVAVALDILQRFLDLLAQDMQP